MRPAAPRARRCPQSKPSAAPRRGPSSCAPTRAETMPRRREEREHTRGQGTRYSTRQGTRPAKVLGLGTKSASTALSGATSVHDVRADA
eukprot:scaffold10162_cov37-Phaeocystis_antarctica.AAC.3